MNPNAMAPDSPVDSFLELCSQHPDAYLLLDSGGVILAINPAGERRIGSSVFALIGMSFTSATSTAIATATATNERRSLPDGPPTETAPSLEEAIAAVTSGGIRRFRGRLVGVDSLCEFTLTPLRNSTPTRAGLVGVLVAVRPITTEDWAQLAQNRRFDSLGTFAGGIAHDLKNALTPTLLSSQMLLQDEHDETNRRLLRSIGSSAIHGASLINRVLRFVRGGENTSYLLDAGAIITTVIDRVRDTLPAEFTIDISLGQRPILILGDTTQLQQVLLNLISNAREAMTGGGNISVRASVNGTTNAAVIIEVEDSGTGIPEEHLEDIFQPLFTTKALGGGTGLGLSTSLRIATAWGGTLSAVNNHGAGATFRLTLPYTPQHTDRNSNNGPNSATPGAALP